MKENIGGFFELELFPNREISYHAHALGFKNARAGISHLIQQTGMQKVWLPYYTCDALLQPFDKAGVPYQFYSVNEQLEIAQLLELTDKEYLVYINYFGIKNNYVQQLIGIYGTRLVIDDTQAYFARGYNAGWSFNSARKSFGVPDGGYLYGPANQLGNVDKYNENTAYKAQYLIDRLRGAQQEAYQGFTAYEQSIDSEPSRISAFSSALLSQVDYAAAAATRRANYALYHAAFRHLNTLLSAQSLSQLPADTVPFCYPLLLANGEALNRQTLFAQGIFVAWLWPDVLTRQAEAYTWERHITQALFPLPVDHRYGPAEINRVIAALQQLLT